MTTPAPHPHPTPAALVEDLAWLPDVLEGWTHNEPEAGFNEAGRVLRRLLEHVAATDPTAARALDGTLEPGAHRQLAVCHEVLAALHASTAAAHRAVSDVLGRADRDLPPRRRRPGSGPGPLPADLLRDAFTATPGESTQ